MMQDTRDSEDIYIRSTKQNFNKSFKYTAPIIGL